MSIKFHWYLPASRIEQSRPSTFDYLAQIARTTDDLGFTSVLTSTEASSEDALIATAALARETERLKFLVAVRPGVLSPRLAAQLASAFQWMSGKRLLLNVAADGASTDERRCDEFLHAMRAAWDDMPYSMPEIYFGGSSAESGEVAARHADVYLARGETVEAVAQRVEWMRGLARTRGRTLRFGIRLPDLVGSDEEVAECIAEYHDLGIDEFIVSSNPQVGEVRRFAAGVMPLLRRRGIFSAADAQGCALATA
ncbi:LLM class flavin-dependent oxidoreductase [Nocardioidaceae bacterium SCSIO 66511]|nr:LLM class flavin-dependent oxidoreductase [Nocardioidaceae bacterium SCSIO 66511]